ncbi:hypothetical protein [Frankia sp. AgKG'84/4]|uniref:hypothetical protein n=1 Tax=Frankia sp. AgKG'84/4 TaxID=573490 RepID=UPI00200DC820|nr:hypothetical protein [Frankia sp. AgKG'84/4]MCL9793776.1 hypothetical protein [Frankia sp. AgKG'84/4]
MTDSLDPARIVAEFLVSNLSETLPPGLLLISDSGADLVVKEGAEVTPCLDLALISNPENADDFAGLIHVALDSVQVAVSRITRLPWPRVGESLNVVDAYSIQVGRSISSGYGTADDPLLPLPPLPLPETLT